MSTTTTAQQFTPKVMEAVKIAGKSVLLYPVLPFNASLAEQAHAFHLNRNAMDTNHIPSREKLEVMGVRLNGSTHVAGAELDWLDIFRTQWDNPKVFTVVSYHDSAGTRITNCCEANGVDLLPLVNGDPATCHPADVRFVKARLLCDFSTLTDGAPCSLMVEYYIELPQSDRNLHDHNQVHRVVRTYPGGGALQTMSQNLFQQNVTKRTTTAGPVDLLPPPFNVQEVVIDSCDIILKIEAMILAKADPFILDHLFKQICPGMSAQPQAALDGINQVAVDENGNRTVESVTTFHAKFMSAIRPFAEQPLWQVDGHAIFIERLEPGLRSQLEQNYRAHRDVVQPRTRRDQLRLLGDALVAAKQAEAHLESIRLITNEQITATQLMTQVHQSQAEKTLSRYGSSAQLDEEGGKKHGRKKPLCFGCGSDGHLWHSPKTKDIICPHANRPGIKEAAQEGYKEWCKNRRGKGKKPRVRYTELTDEDKERVARQYEARLADGKETLPSGVPASDNKPTALTAG